MPQQGGYPPPQQGGYPPPQQGGYPPPQGGYPPPQQGGYPPPQKSGNDKVCMFILICFELSVIAVFMKEGKCGKNTLINALLYLTVIGNFIHGAWYCFDKD